jgi:purine-binding chemotaxis protein CheW
VINLEGNVIPVVDTSTKLGMGPTQLHEQSQVIVMQRMTNEQERAHLLAFVTDDVCDIADIEPRKIQKLPNTKFEFDEILIDGMHKVNGEFCMQINLENLYRGEIQDLILNLSKQHIQQPK